MKFNKTFVTAVLVSLVASAVVDDSNASGNGVAIKDIEPSNILVDPSVTKSKDPPAPTPTSENKTSENNTSKSKIESETSSKPTEKPTPTKDENTNTKKSETSETPVKKDTATKKEEAKNSKEGDKPTDDNKTKFSPTGVRLSETEEEVVSTSIVTEEINGSTQTRTSVFTNKVKKTVTYSGSSSTSPIANSIALIALYFIGINMA